MPLTPIPEILNDIRAGKMVILVDDPDRENEGDLCMAAEHVTPETINFRATHARGWICVTLDEDLADGPTEAARQVCEFVGQPQAAIPPVEDTGLERMANDMTRDWMRRFRAEPHLARMRGPDFEV